MRKITEETSLYRHLEKKSTHELLLGINQEDQKVALAVSTKIEMIGSLVDTVVLKMKEGGRLFYIGAGTSGRLGVLDASECPPTFGVSDGWVIGLIAGGDVALRKAVEAAEDSHTQAWKDLDEYLINELDTVIGIAASGTTPYVVYGLKDCQKNNISTGCITCNPGAPVVQYADFPIEVEVGPEFVTGSTRLKSGTAQKLILNMISTTVMIKLGRVEDNKMVDMMLSNNKLIDRGTKMLIEQFGIPYQEAQKILLAEGSVRKAKKKLLNQ